MEACSHWLAHEFATVRPSVVVVLGATALHALLRESASLSDYLSGPFELEGGWGIATYHPSFALRQRDGAAREKVTAAITGALIKARQLAASRGAGPRGAR